MAKTSGYILVNEGLRTLRSFKSSKMASHGIPDHLLQMCLAEDGYPEHIDQKLNTAFDLIDKGYQVFMLTGPESPEKDFLAVLILLGRLGSKKFFIRYYHASTFDTHDVGDLAVMGIDEAKGLPLTKLQGLMRPQMTQGKIAIISGSTMESIEKALGTSLMDYLAHLTIEIKVDSKRPKIPAI